MIEKLEKKIKEGQERWERIEEKANLIRGDSDLNGNMHFSRDKDTLAELLLLIVEHLRPMNPSQEQVEQMTNSLTTILKGIGK